MDGMSRIVVHSRNNLDVAVCADEAGSGQGQGNNVASMHLESCLDMCVGFRWDVK